MDSPDPTDYTFQDSIEIEAPAQRVWALVSDVTRTGEWSPVCRGCEWDDPTHTGVGATFTGHNETADRTWQTTSTVITAEPHRAFAWEVNQGFVRWGYELTPLAEDRTELTETWAFLQPGLDFFQEKFGEHAQREIDARRDQAHADIPRTLARIQQIAQS